MRKMSYIVEYLNGQQEIIKNNSSLAKIDYSTVKHVGTIEKLPPYLKKGFIPEFNINLAIPLYLIKKQIERGELLEETRKRMIASCKKEINSIMTQIALYYGEHVEDKDLRISSETFQKMVSKVTALEYRIKILSGYQDVHKKKNNTVIKTLSEIHNHDNFKVVEDDGFSLF